MPLPGMLKRKAEKVIIDTALKGLKSRVEGLRTQATAPGSTQLDKDREEGAT